mmetsp:Transcript_418/g.736  ORF Transcript_418/g.736 Transcript_418/m.736 type:complete len:338 (+) Transcript_418:471-1484(+)|eukprot:CAMPEP_0198203710 /NCGR_PEP_ID=MMETSP1445-20131203/7033_1 /TAXON_ID=36898 /ORGANISM="Pyramimonas sp., Strain CCMP2087" /LENGTH=337 /DNA_ID=CAMNT_0043875215 /DNA_START=382 /DNA_END=1395 /DNA_ORIENTATION=-
MVSKRTADDGSEADESLQDLHAKYAAFYRNDQCGIVGTGPYTTMQKVKMGLACVCLLPVVRLTVCTSCVVLCYLGCKFSKTLPRSWQRSFAAKWGGGCARAFLFALGFYYIRETYDSPKDTKTTKPPPPIISNHIGMWDILYFMSSHYPSFVANSGVAKIRMVGTICESMGSMFIRRNADDVTHGDAAVKGNAARMVERLTDPTAPRMLIFPEGTTTNGKSLLPFKRGPFLAKVPVQPVLLQYDYKHFSPAWESIAPMPSLALMSVQWVNTLRVQYLPVYTPSEAEKADPELYASNVRLAMAKAGGLGLSKLTLEDKRVYHSQINPKPASKADKKDT